MLNGTDSFQALRSEKETFITGESEKIHEKSGFIRLYERKEGQAFESITPLQSYEEHKVCMFVLVCQSLLL